MRFHILQNGLKDRHTHFYVETLGWLKACHQRGVPVQVYALKEARPSVLQETGALPVFDFAPGLESNVDPLFDKLRTFITTGLGFAQNLREAIPQVGADDIFIVPFTTDSEMFGMAQWLSTIPADQCPQVIFIFHNPDFQWKVLEGGTTFNGDISRHRFAAWELARKSAPGRVHYFATNQALCQAMSKVTGKDFTRCPVPIDYLEEEEAKRGESDPEFKSDHVGMMGEFRTEKGANIIPAVIERFHKARPGRSIFVQTRTHEQVANIQHPLAHLEIPDLSFSVGEFSQWAYIRRMRSLDILLLPYVWQRYAMRISGVFAESVAYGTAVVVPANTWMATQLEAGNGAGTIFSEDNADAICEALVRASDNVAVLKEKARACSAQWRRTQSTPALVDQIIARLNRA